MPNVTPDRSRAWNNAAVLAAMVTLLMLLALPSQVLAQCSTPGNPPCPGTLLTGFYSISKSLVAAGSDNTINLIDPVGSANGGLIGLTPVDICAMIYVFDNNDNLGECCGCPLTPEDLLTFSVSTDLTANWGGPQPPATGTIEIISTFANPRFVSRTAPQCSPGTNFTPARELNGYISYLNPVSEIPLQDSGDPSAELQAGLISKCSALQAQSPPKTCICPSQG
jgi:hypothetical protein